LQEGRQIGAGIRGAQQVAGDREIASIRRILLTRFGVDRWRCRSNPEKILKKRKICRITVISRNYPHHAIGLTRIIRRFGARRRDWRTGNRCHAGPRPGV